MLNTFNPISVKVSAPADEQNAIKSNSTKLQFKRKPVFSWLTNSNNDNTQILKPNIILSDDQLNNNNINNNKENSSQPELRGVQNLKQLWNRRIGAIRDTTSSVTKVLSPAKSYGCLLQEEKPPLDITRALSLHNCAEIKESTVSLRSTKDNFYKYKTAATTEKSHSVSPACTPTHVISNRLRFNFPMIGATPKGEQIHWMRRDDIIVRRKYSNEESPLSPLETDTKMNLMTSLNKVVASPATPRLPSKPCTPPANTLIICDNNSNESSHPISETRDAISSHCSSSSLRSLESTTPRKKNVNSSRKYSFKTQIKSYHSPRKMPYYTGNTASNKVAKLTQQFNEIIQKDKKILDEVKRNNGILISRGGHVYKVIENSEQSMTTVPPATVLPISKEDTSTSTKTNSTVQRVIKTFENKTIEKPKLPLKSAQVLRKKKELGIANRKEAKCELKSAILEGIQEEVKISTDEYQTLKTVADKNDVLCSKQPEDSCNLKINKVKELIERSDNRVTIKTALNQNEIMIVPQKDSHLCKESEINTELLTETKYTKIYEKFRLRGVFRNNEQGGSKVPGDVSKGIRTGVKLKLKTEQIPTEDVTSCLFGDQTKSNPPIYHLTPSNQSSEAKILKLDVNSIDSVEQPSDSAGDSQIRSEDTTLNGNSLKDEFREAINQYVDAEDKESSEKLSELSILNAIEEVNQKIESLAWKSEEKSGFEYSPNESFLYQVNLKVNSSEDILVEAVNTSLVNFTESQMIQDDRTIVDNNDTDNIAALTTAIDESAYEFIAIDPKHVKTPDPIVQPQKSFLFCNSKRHGGSHEIFKQSTQELTESYESCENYESINGSCETTPYPDYGYEICETPDSIPPPRPQKEPTELQRNTTDKLPELPKPKRIIPKKLFATVATTDISPQVSESGSINDEENIYDTIKGGHHCYELLQSSKEKSADTISLTSNGYESINHYRRQPQLCKVGSSSTISSDHKTNSLYEVSLVNGMLSSSHNYSHSYITSSENSDEWVDISDTEMNNYDRIEKQQFIVVRERMKCHRSPDWSKRVRDKRQHQTISDDVCYLKNELISYEMDPSDTGTIKTVPRQRRPRAVGEVYITSPSSSIYLNGEFREDNVINEPIYQNTEIEQLNRKIIRQRDRFSAVRMEVHLANETHTTLVTFVDDVDHYYEPLFPLGNTSFPNEIRNASTPETQNSKHIGNNKSCLAEDYDSFDTDDDVYEDDESVKKNDSGVDISNVKLPNPPPSKNQVYAFVKKFKNFISSKKSPSDPNKNLADTVQAKMYENTQFQVEGNEYQSTLKPTRRAPDKPKTPKTKIKKLIDRPVNKDNSKDDNIYENTDFHNPKLKTPSQLNCDNVNQLSTSEKNLIAVNEVSIRSKSKAGKSFKSRLKSFGASGFENKQISTMTAARSTFYVSEAPASEQDSGIFEKTSSGDLITSTSKTEIDATDNKSVANVRKNKKEINTSNAYRRRTTIGIRPNDPPPPPPMLSEDNKQLKQRSSATSWYAECGVFKINNNMSADDANSEKPTSNLNKSTSNTSWYAEAGLYQTSGVSVASSSGSSGVSMGNEGGIGDDINHHMFLNEPLYQIYNAEKLESISRDMEDHESTDGYEEIGMNGHNSENEQTKRTRPTALQLVGPKSGPSRTLWSEIPEVISSEILLTLTPRERSLQEAKFEVITSEASYLKSLNLLRSHFMNHHTFHDTTILSSRDRKTLFSYIAPVHECSEKLLSELETCWQDNIMLLGLSKSIYACAEKNFHVYVSYCEHQGKMDRTLRKLKEAKGIFCQKLDSLESDSVCCGLTLHSFLMLPMQRITRLPLLIDAVFSKVHHNDDEYENWKLTLAILNKIVAQCNEAANRCEQAYEIERISRQLEFPSHIRALAIAPVGVAATGAKPRFLVKKGELVHLMWRGDDAKLTFGKKFTKSNIYAFLFSDLMVLTKRKGEEQFTVFDYCPRNMLTISSGDAIPQLPTKDANQTGKNLIFMTLLENYERKTVELVVSCPSVSELERWLQATRPPEAETPGEKLYEQWDCPQVIAKHEYIANEPDLLSLEVGDVVNVSRKLPDGWFNGERIRDGAVGWFPGSFTEEVNSAHVRARNLKQRYRLLTFTATYLELQKRK